MVDIADVNFSTESDSILTTISYVLSSLKTYDTAGISFIFRKSSSSKPCVHSINMNPTGINPNV